MLNAGNLFYILFSRYLKRQMREPYLFFFCRKKTKIAQTQIKIFISNIVGTSKTADKDWKFHKLQ